MSREIKFRCWDKAEKRMLYRGVFDLNWYATPYNDENGCNCVRGITPDDRPKVELMQYTGLKDKNGVEIYEGDVAKITLRKDLHTDAGTELMRQDSFIYEQIAPMVFHEGCFKFTYNTEFDDDCIVDSVEVIGNIYENPELLESKDE